jgi:hypothetical protein
LGDLDRLFEARLELLLERRVGHVPNEVVRAHAHLDVLDDGGDVIGVDVVVSELKLRGSRGGDRQRKEEQGE